MNAHLTPRFTHQWQPTARSEHGRHVQASRLRQALIEAVYRRGQEIHANPDDVSVAMDRVEDLLRARGWHPDQFPYGDPLADFDERTDVDYDPAMLAFDHR